MPSLSFDVGDLASEIDKIDLFDIKPRKRRSGNVRLAGKPPRRLPPITVTLDETSSPEIGHNGGPPLDPPEIPKQRTSTTEGRMTFVRRAAVWIGRIGRRTPVVDAFLGMLDQMDELKSLTDMIKTANDPPQTLEVLRDRATHESEDGYHDHHIVNQHDDNRDKFGDDRIQSRDNVVRMPILKHIEISKWYSTKNKDYGFRPPQERVRVESFEEQMRIGLDVLRDFKVIK